MLAPKEPALSRIGANCTMIPSRSGSGGQVGRLGLHLSVDKVTKCLFATKLISNAKTD